MHPTGGPWRRAVPRGSLDVRFLEVAHSVGGGIRNLRLFLNTPRRARDVGACKVISDVFYRLRSFSHDFWFSKGIRGAIGGDLVEASF